MYAHVPTVALDAVTVTGNSAGGIVNGGGQLYLNAGTKITNNLAVQRGRHLHRRDQCRVPQHRVDRHG